MFGLDTPRGGSPWGAGTLAGPDGSRQPSEVELEQAEYQVSHGLTQTTHPANSCVLRTHKVLDVWRISAPSTNERHVTCVVSCDVYDVTE